MNANKNILDFKRLKENIINKKCIYLEYNLVITWIGIVWYNTMSTILRLRKKILKNNRDIESHLVHVGHIYTYL